ncbi:MAG: hypothetical protein KF841_01215 [Phycisphaerae bacterium]|nr:hypothetical protein [Phycisphaerae bacterium]
MAAQTMDSKTMNNNGVDNMFKTVNENFRTAYDNSVKFQQDTMKAVTGMFNGCDSMDDYRSKFEVMANDTINMVRKNAEQTQKSFDENCKNGMNVIKKAFETTRGDNKDMFVMSRDMFSTMFDMMKSNVEMFTRTTTATIENMSDFVNKSISSTAPKGK